MASEPYKAEAAPRITSTRCNKLFGMPISPYTVPRLLIKGMPSMVTNVYGPSMPLMWISPALQTLQFTWGCRPFTICSDSKIFGPGLARRKLRVSVSTGTGLSLRFTGFRVPLITSSSMPALSVCAAAIAGRNKIRKDIFSLYENMVSGSKSILFCL